MQWHARFIIGNVTVIKENVVYRLSEDPKPPTFEILIKYGTFNKVTLKINFGS